MSIVLYKFSWAVSLNLLKLLQMMAEYAGEHAICLLKEPCLDAKFVNSATPYAERKYRNDKNCAGCIVKLLITYSPSNNTQRNRPSSRCGHSPGPAVYSAAVLGARLFPALNCPAQMPARPTLFPRPC